MNALLPLFTAAGDAADQKAANLLAAARALTPHLNRSRALDRKLVSGVMTMMELQLWIGWSKNKKEALQLLLPLQLVSGTIIELI